MKIKDGVLKKLLLEANYVSNEDIKNAQDYGKIHSVNFLDYLLTERLITKDLVGQAISESYGVKYSDLNTNIPTREQVLRIPEEIGRRNRVVIYKENEKEVILTTDDPKGVLKNEEVKGLFPNQKVIITFSLEEDINNVLTNYRQDLKKRVKEILKGEGMAAPQVIKEILNDAILNTVSDIHFEPEAKEVNIRFRIDGVLEVAGKLSKELYENILNWIKVQAHMRIDDHFSAQDGAIRYKDADDSVDMRVSIIPVLDGEKVTIRILSKYVRGFSLADVGLSSRDQEILTEAAKKPFGMILVTGPTGSGKTTTLYSLLRMLNQPGTNVTTIEDPVEYRMKGTNQIQVNARTDLTFAKGLRSIVRQDPDVILVGEIRDQETAEIAVNAALTGHLLLSTFHANDAATAIPRLLDMGIEPFLLASTLEVIVAQRLIRRVCEHCKYSHEVSRAELGKIIPNVKKYFDKAKVTLYKGKGCDSCGGNGYKGRTAIFEILYMTKKMRDYILTNPSSKEIWDLAIEEGANSLFEDGLDKVRNGLTTVEELLRVAPPYVKDIYNDEEKTKKDKA